MKTAGNVIFFRKTASEAPQCRAGETLAAVTLQEEMSLISKARKVVDEIEESWEQDHGRPELRDKFHLLRYYLGRLPDKAPEEGKSIMAFKEE